MILEDDILVRLHLVVLSILAAPVLPVLPPSPPLSSLPGCFLVFLGSSRLAAPASARLASPSSPSRLLGRSLRLSSVVSSSHGLVSSLLLWGTSGGDTAVRSEVCDSLVVSAPFPPLTKVEEAANVCLPVAAIVQLLPTGPLGLVVFNVHSIHVVRGGGNVFVLTTSSLLHPPGSSEGPGSGPASASSSPPSWGALSLRQEDGEENQSYEQAETELHLG